MLRRACALPLPSARRVTAAPVAASAALVAAPRAFCCELVAAAACPLWCHFGSIAGGVSGAALASSPVGTVALVALAFNVNYVGLKHLWYTSEFPMRDYLQDAALKQCLRYMMLISLMLAGNGYFVEY